MFVARADRTIFSGIEETYLSYGGLLRAVSTVFGFLVGGIYDNCRLRNFLVGFRFVVLSFA